MVTYYVKEDTFLKTNSYDSKHIYISKTVKNIIIFCFISDALDNPLDIMALKISLKNIKYLHYESPVAFSQEIDTNFSKLVSVMGQNLEKFTIGGYANRQDILLDFIKSKILLKELNLLCCCVNEDFFISVSKIKDLKLKSVRIRHSPGLVDYGLQVLVNSQRNIEHLDLSRNFRIRDEALLSICFYLPRLKTLKIHHCICTHGVSIFIYFYLFI